jgi:hypothetical protein
LIEPYQAFEYQPVTTPPNVATPPAAQPAPVQEPKTTLENIEDAITALKDGWVATALNTLEEARLHEMTRTK